MIDSHAHLLPAIDDGAKDLEMSLAMAKLAAETGTSDIVCTPHHLDGVFSNKRRDVLEQVRRLGEQLAEAGIAVAVHPGSELHLVPELVPQVLAGDALTYNDKGVAVLVELPKKSLPVGTETVFGRLLSHGITPLIAHPERNAVLLDAPEHLEEWVSWGCKLQLTAQSCTGDFGEARQALCRHWCERGLVHVVASDGHRPSGRPPVLRDGYRILETWLGEEGATVLTRSNPQRLLDGAPLLDLEPLEDADDITAPRRAGSRRAGSRRAGWLSRLLGRNGA